MDTQHDLASEIEAAAASLGISPSTLGARAGQGGRFYVRLKDGKRVWPETAAKVRGWIAAQIGASGSPAENVTFNTPDAANPGAGCQPERSANRGRE